MATFFSSPAFLSHPLKRTQHFISSSQTPLPPNPSEPQSPNQQLNITTSFQQFEKLSVKVEEQKPSKSVTKVESTDWIATTLTRRFGIGAGLAWAAFLAVGVISEQIKTRLEVSQQQSNTRDVEKEEEVILSNGIRYYELKVGGGATPRAGDLVVMNLKGKAQDNGEVFVDTNKNDKKPLVLIMGNRPYSKGVCEGIEYALRFMKAGGKRRVIVPPSLGFGETGANLGYGVEVPPFATLEYIIELDKVSIAPA